VQRYRELAASLRRVMPDIALSTDIIVGHPGESPEEFQATVDLVKELHFDKIHLAAFSSRPGTRAAVLEEDLAQAIPESVKAQRRVELERVQEGIATERSARLLHTVVEVLVEGESK
jgi:tRNA-2-methylthio-N6-dimethylallyladenosine synthase